MHSKDGITLLANTPFTLGGKQYPRNWLALASADDLAAAGIVYTPDPPSLPVVPSAVTMRQARLALLDAGLLTSVNNAVAAMTGTAGEAARIEWEYAMDVVRTSPLVVNLSAALGLTSEQLDSLFTVAAAL